MNYFTFNNESSQTYGLYIGGQGTFNAPERSVTKYSIPGRNGDLIIDNGRFNNIDVTYNVVAMDNFITKSASLNSWLLSNTGYKKLEDTYHTGKYRLARVTGDIVYTTAMLNTSGKAKITFDCKPQIFLTQGDTLTSITSGGTITNPTRFTSKPLVRAYGNGTVTIGNKTITITNNSDSYIDIDCDLMDAYRGSTNKNNDITAPSGFFELAAGSNTVTFTVTSVQIAGKWWTL